MKFFGLKVFKERQLDTVFFDQFVGLRYLLNDRSDPVIFDVGANIGQSASAYRRVFPNAEIHSFEPNPEVFDELRRNTITDRRVYSNCMALGAQEGTGVLHVHPYHPACSLVGFNPDSVTKANAVHRKEASRTGPIRHVEVPISTLDHYCHARKIERIDLLKIDVQGYEVPVLRGGSEMLAQGRIHVILAEIIFDDFYQRPSSFFEVESVIRPFGFCLYDISHIYKDLKRGRTHWVDAMYAPLRPNADSVSEAMPWPIWTSSTG